VAIAFGGFGYTQPASEVWITNIATAAGFEAMYGITDFFAVKGPADQTYEGQEISTSKIVAYLAAQEKNAVCTGASALKVVVIGHSSGGFVAGDFFRQLNAAAPGVVKQTVYYNLDGSTAQLAPIVNSLFWYFPVCAAMTDGSLTSMNYDGVSSSFPHAPKRRFIKLIGDHSGCVANPKGKIGNWCLHMFCVQVLPYSHTSIDYLDVTQVNAAHPVQIDFITQTRNELAQFFAQTPAAAPVTVPSAAAPHPPPRAAKGVLQP